MEKNNNNDKHNQLKNEILNNDKNYVYSYLILKLLNKGVLNNLINKISDTNTKVKITTVTKKAQLSDNEQFLYLLNNFIYIFKEDFYFLQNDFEYILEVLLQNEKYTKYLLCKKYIGDNKNISYFSFNIKKLIIHGFYNNLKKLSKESELIKKYTKDHNINLRKCCIDNPKDIEIIYNALVDLTISNAKTINNLLLFEDINHYTEQMLKNPKYNCSNIKNVINQYYITNWEYIIKNYYDKKEAINTLFA